MELNMCASYANWDNNWMRPKHQLKYRPLAIKLSRCPIAFLKALATVLNSKENEEPFCELAF